MSNNEKIKNILQSISAVAFVARDELHQNDDYSKIYDWATKAKALAVLAEKLQDKKIWQVITTKRLKEARELIGYSIIIAAEKSNINPDMLYGFEDGTQEPSFSQLSRLADIYKISVDKLMRDEQIKKETMIWCNLHPQGSPTMPAGVKTPAEPVVDKPKCGTCLHKYNPTVQSETGQKEGEFMSKSVKSRQSAQAGKPPSYINELEKNIDRFQAMSQKKIEKRICIVAFSDKEGNSLAYKKFDDIDRAVDFYRYQLEKDDVNVISTRKTIVIKKDDTSGKR